MVEVADTDAVALITLTRIVDVFTEIFAILS
jgi:hypothetical protein